MFRFSLCPRKHVLAPRDQHPQCASPGLPPGPQSPLKGYPGPRQVPRITASCPRHQCQREVDREQLEDVAVLFAQRRTHRRMLREHERANAAAAGSVSSGLLAVLPSAGPDHPSSTSSSSSGVVPLVAGGGM